MQSDSQPQGVFVARAAEGPNRIDELFGLLLVPFGGQRQPARHARRIEQQGSFVVKNQLKLMDGVEPPDAANQFGLGDSQSIARPGRHASGAIDDVDELVALANQSEETRSALALFGRRHREAQPFQTLLGPRRLSQRATDHGNRGGRCEHGARLEVARYCRAGCQPSFAAADAPIHDACTEPPFARKAVRLLGSGNVGAGIEFSCVSVRGIGFISGSAPGFCALA